jgi:DNA-binding transcriptional MerR regulator
MPKKRTRLTRSPDLRTRRKRTAPPTVGWLKSELAKLAHVAPTTIAKYVKAGLLPSAEFRGTATRYTRVHLLRLLAIRYLRAEGLMPLQRIKNLLARMTAEQLEMLVVSRTKAPALLAALREGGTSGASEVNPHASNAQGLEAHLLPSIGNDAIYPNEPRSTTRGVEDAELAEWLSPNGEASVREPSPGNGAPLANAMLLAETWQHVQLAPGVVLSWKTDASASSKGLVQRLVSSVGG